MQLHATAWDWIQFIGAVALLLAGLTSLAFRRAPAARVLWLRLWYGFVNVVGGAAELAAIALWRALKGLALHLWRGPTPPAPVNSFYDDDLDYVAPPAPAPSPDLVSAPASVCLSEPEAPPAPPEAVVLERLKIDRSREAALALYVALGWEYSEVREVLRFDNNKLRAAYDAAAAQKSAAAAAVVSTPWGGRPVAPDAFPAQAERPRAQLVEPA